MTIEQIKTQKSGKPIHFKALDGTEVEVDIASRKISGYGAIWNVIDDAGDMLIKGCCAKSIQERGVGSKTNRKMVFLWQHDTDEPLGQFTKMVEDSKGLYFEAVFDTIEDADRALIQLKSGTLNQFSIGFNYVWDKCEWDSEKGCLVVKEINLFEISVVTFGCNEETGFEGMKSGQIESEQKKLNAETERYLKTMPYEDSIKIRQLITKHMALSEVKPPQVLSQPKPTEVKEPIDFKLLTNILKQK